MSKMRLLSPKNDSAQPPARIMPDRRVSEVCADAQRLWAGRMLRNPPRNAEPKVLILMPRMNVDAIGGAAVLAMIEPAATQNHTVGTGPLICWIPFVSRELMDISCSSDYSSFVGRNLCHCLRPNAVRPSIHDESIKLIFQF